VTPRRYELAEFLTLGYLIVVAGVVSLRHEGVPRWYLVPVGCAAYAVALLALVYAHHRRPGLYPLRLVAPLAAIPLVYTAIDRYVLALHGRFLDTQMLRAETVLFGGHPNLVLDSFAVRPLSELMTACYMSYYGYFLVAPVVLLARRRHEELRRYVLAVLLPLYVCYLGFLVVPLRGPVVSLRDSFAQPHLTGYLLVPAQRFVMDNADPGGTCFPSAHVALAWVAVFALRRTFGERVFRAVVPVNVGLTVAVVYCRYHYLADVIAGLLVAALCLLVLRRLAPRATDPPPAVGQAITGQTRTSEPPVTIQVPSGP
jgi:membrane-associated phospholipid phosphatase